MTYNQLKPGSVLVSRNDNVGVWLVIGKDEDGHNMWVDLANTLRAPSTAQGEDQEVNLRFYELFEP